MTLRDYLNETVLRHGCGESWIPDITLEQLATIRALADRELTAALTVAPEIDE